MRIKLVKNGATPLPRPDTIISSHITIGYVSLTREVIPGGRGIKSLDWGFRMGHDLTTTGQTLVHSIGSAR